MNRPVPRLGSREIPRTPHWSTFEDVTHLALPVDTQRKLSAPAKIIDLLKREFSIDFDQEFEKAGEIFTGKSGEVLEIPVHKSGRKLSRVLLTAVGEASDQELRKIGATLGRKVKGTSGHLLSFCATKSDGALVHLNALALATYSWSAKTGAIPQTPEFTLAGDFSETVARARVLVSATWRARDLIHTPANIKSPAWMAAQARKLATDSRINITVRSGRELSEFGGLRAVGNSSSVNPPRFVEVSYRPKSSKKVPHVVLVGKGITFDTGGVSLKRPYDTMMAMKSDMSGAAAVLLATIAAAELDLPVRVTALLMLAENALSGTSQRPSDVITHYGGTTVEVINTDAEGRLVLADGLAYAVANLSPDYLIDVATLTGAATLGLSRFYGALYTRDLKLARNFHAIGEYIGDRIWHMPLVDDYDIALVSDVADYNHTADKYKFQGGSVTAALFLEKFVADRRWAHLDIAGPARSEVDAGENPKGGTGYGVRLLTEWIASL